MKNDCKLKRDYEWCGIWEKRNCECVGCVHHIPKCPTCNGSNVEISYRYKNRKYCKDCEKSFEIQNAGRVSKK